MIADSTSANRGSGRRVEAALIAKFDRAANEELSNNWFVFRDHQGLYHPLNYFSGGGAQQRS